MESIDLGASGRRTTRLGYGCSSLMGALERRESLALLELAFDAGIRHFDVAPVYGYGAAEGCLGEFLKRHRGEVTVTTKFGIAPARHQPLLALARRLARPAVRLLPGVKQQLIRTANNITHTGSRGIFTAANASASLRRSLTELQVERLDVWLLHEVESQDLATDPSGDKLLRMMKDAVTAGDIGTFGVGSSAAKIPGLLTEHPAYCRTLQYEWSILDRPLAEAASPTVTAAHLKRFRMHHRALSEAFRSLHRELTADGSLCRSWSDRVGADLVHRETLAALMLKASLLMNPGSVILISSKNPAHLQQNVRVADDESLATPAIRLYELAQAHTRVAATI